MSIKSDAARNLVASGDFAAEKLLSTTKLSEIASLFR